MDPEAQAELEAKATPNVVKPKKAKKAKKANKQPEAPAPQEAGRRVLKTITEQLPVPLSKREAREMGMRLAQQEGEIDNHRAHADQVKTELKAREAEIRSSISACSMALRNGTKIQDVPVQLEADFAAGVVRYVRMDDQTEIRTRALANEERQESIFDKDDLDEPGSVFDKAKPDFTEPLPSGVTRATEV